VCVCVRLFVLLNAPKNESFIFVKTRVRVRAQSIDEKIGIVRAQLAFEKLHTYSGPASPHTYNKKYCNQREENRRQFFICSKNTQK